MFCLSPVYTPNQLGGNIPDLGLVLLDAALRPVYACPVALRVLSLRQNGAAAALSADIVAERMREILAAGSMQLDAPRATWRFHWQGRPFRCTRLRLEAIDPLSGLRAPTAVLLAEESAEPDPGDLARRFGLTERERQTLRLIMEGLPTREIARQLGISASTAKTYVRMTSAKMGVIGRDQLMAKLIRHAGGVDDLGHSRD